LRSSLFLAAALAVAACPAEGPAENGGGQNANGSDTTNGSENGGQTQTDAGANAADAGPSSPSDGGDVEGGEDGGTPVATDGGPGAGTDAGNAQGGDDSGVAPPGGDGGGGPAPDCPAIDGNALTTDSLIQDFTTDVYPLMTREPGGCTACHAAGSGRQLEMGVNAGETFHKIRTGGFFDLEAGSMFARVDADEMPDQGPYWSAVEKDALKGFVCKVMAFDEANPDAPPLDEIFPPALEDPYTGALSTEYDNTFLTFEQLKGRVAVQFGDDWVRNSVDQFAENITLFGGVDFTNTFIAARGATPEFLVGLDVMAPDVCGQAAANGTGPFAGLDLAAPTMEEPSTITWNYSVDDYISIDGGGDVRAMPWSIGGTDPRYLNLYSNGGGRVDLAVPIDGTYTFQFIAQGREGGPDLPHMEIRAGVQTPVGFDVPEGPGFLPYATDIDMPAGTQPVDVVFTNDYWDPDNGIDRNARLASLAVWGPLPGSTSGAPGARDATLSRLESLFERILLRAPVRDADPLVDEVVPLYDLLMALEAFDGDRQAAYQGVCEALLRHPDFLFTRPPSFDLLPLNQRERLLLVGDALNLLDRPPTADELSRYDVGQATRDDLLTEWLASTDFRDAFYHRMRLLLESDGTPEGDEPARLFTYLFLQDRPIKELLTSDYGVDAAFAQTVRLPEHAGTGLLTMEGYIKSKPGLPHYNYAARVLTGFLGFIFEVPQEVFDQRDTATAASTVDPTSICYNCHRVLTPLAHQRLKWLDDGTYRDVDDNGDPIDDTDRGMVEGYPYAGTGMAGFAAAAVRKEGFIRRMANTQFQMLFTRQLRHDEDERSLYYDLWMSAAEGEGTFRDILVTIMHHDAYVNPVGTTP
jgi:hypothetical protein